MKNKVYILAFFALFLVSFVLAEVPYYNDSYTVLATTGGSSSFQVSELRYEPYPVTPGEYFKLFVQVEKKGSTRSDVSFELQQDYPFSVDNSADAVKEFENIGTDPIVLEYKVRVADDAVSGENTLTIVERHSDGSMTEHEFEIYVYDVKTSFDAVVQDEESGEYSIALANIGNNDALSTIVRVPKQDGITVSGTSAQMIGNLEQGDYTVVGFTLSKANADNLILQIDYTDSIGERRSQNVTIDLESGTSVGVFPSNMTQIMAQNGNSSTSVWTYIIYTLIFIVLISALWLLYKYKIKNKKFHSANLDWMKKEKEKESHK